MQPEQQSVSAPSVSPQVRYAIENPADLKAATRVWHEILPMMAEHFNAKNKELGLGFQPDWQQIADLLVARRLIIACGRLDGQLKGYQIWLLNDTLWAIGTRTAYLWAMTGGRKAGCDQEQLLRVVFGYFKTLGVTALFASAQAGSSQYRLLEKAEFGPLEVMMGRKLWRSQ